MELKSMQQRLKAIVKEKILPSIEGMAREHVWQIGFDMGMMMAMLHPEWVQAYIKQLGIGDVDRRGTDSLVRNISVDVVQEEPHEQ